MLLTAGLVNFAATMALLVVAWRRGGLLLLALMAAAMSFLIHAAGQQFLVDPWNPSITAIPFGCLMVLTWSAARGSAGALVAGAVVGSFVVQSHVAYTLMVAWLWAVATFGFVRMTGAWRKAGLAAIVAAACWLPVLIDEAAGGHNLSLLFTFFTGSHHTIGLSRALRVSRARELVSNGPWRSGPEPTIADGSIAGRSATLLVTPFLTFLAVGALAWWRGVKDAVALQFIVGVTVLIGLLSLSHTNDAAMPWLVRWWWPLAMCFWVAVAYSFVRVVSTFPASVLSLGAAVTFFAYVCASTSWSSANAPKWGLPAADFQPVLAAVTGPTLAAVHPGTTVYLRAVGPDYGWIRDGLAARLARHGVHVKVDPDDRFRFGTQRVWKGRRPITSVLIATGTWDQRCAGQPTVESLATWDVHDPKTTAAGRAVVLFTNDVAGSMCFRATY